MMSGKAEIGRADVQVLAVVLAVTVLLGVVPPLLYLPLRVARSRERRGLRRKLADRPDAMLVEHLARAAGLRMTATTFGRVRAGPGRMQLLDVAGRAAGSGRHRR
jgi:hypothetical protein